MHLDVLDLRTFYYRTKLGRSAQRALQDALRALWPETHGMTVAGFGFATPMLRPYLGEARRVVALMPSQQGVIPWPVGGPNVSALVEETEWPLASGSIDRLIVAHGLETCERPHDLLDEIWRVLAPQGQAIFIVPNRSGLWARRDVTPFGFGRPYSFGQLEAILARHRLAPERHAAALYAPPSHRRFWLQTAQLWERLGRRFDPHLVAGALLMEVTKQVFARPQSGAKAAVRSPLDMFGGIARPKPEPVSGRLTAARELLRGTPAQCGERGQSHEASTYCHPAVPLLSPRRFTGA
jgi:SAM-dependent methyltransferase